LVTGARAARALLPRARAGARSVPAASVGPRSRAAGTGLPVGPRAAAAARARRSGALLVGRHCGRRRLPLATLLLLALLALALLPLDPLALLALPFLALLLLAQPLLLLIPVVLEALHPVSPVDGALEHLVGGLPLPVEEGGGQRQGENRVRAGREHVRVEGVDERLRVLDQRRRVGERLGGVARDRLRDRLGRGAELLDLCGDGALGRGGEEAEPLGLRGRRGLLDLGQEAVVGLEVDRHAES